MVDVNATVSGILMCCDDSVLGINFGKDYQIKKIYFDDLPFKDRITNGQGMLTVDYFSSRLYDSEKVYFMCIEKEATFQIAGLQLDPQKRVYTDRDFDCQDQIQPWKESENKFLYEMIALLHLFKSGNVGFRDVFYHFEYNTGIMNNKVNNKNHQETRNVLDERKFSLTEDEVSSCNHFLAEYSGKAFELMRPCIDEFAWGLEQIDPPTGFEQYTTALEMTLLKRDQQGKKQSLAKRVAVMVGASDADIQRSHQQMLNFYRFRSESLHEGDGNSISDVELRELEEIVREVLRKCLQRCKSELSTNANVTWNEIKAKIIDDLKNQVTILKTRGVLPH